MPKTKDGGFLLDDSGLAPYNVGEIREKNNPENNAGEASGEIPDQKSKN